MPRISLRYKQIILAIVLLMTSVSCGVSASPEVQPDENGSVDPELILGREIWGIHCSSCHGASGQGVEEKTQQRRFSYKLPRPNVTYLGHPERQRARDASFFIKANH